MPTTPTFAHLIYTYDKLAEAKINQELSKSIYGKVPIIHAYNGDKNPQEVSYLEDFLVSCTNRGHFKGAVDLINLGVAKSVEIDVEYLVITAADTWFTSPDFVHSLLTEMKAHNRKFAASAWGSPALEKINKVGASLDFLVLDLSWQREYRIFPLPYDEYLDKFLEQHFALNGGTCLIPERCLIYQLLMKYSTRYQDTDIARHLLQDLRLIDERHPIHIDDRWTRNMEYPNINLYTYHDKAKQAKLLTRIASKISLGKVAKSFIKAHGN